MYKNILGNPWVITIGSGLIVTVVGILFRKKTKNNNKTEQSSKQSQSVSQTVIVSNGSLKENMESNKGLEIRQDVSDLKRKIKILFIEDDVFKKINNLKKFGWNVSQINKVDNLDTEEIKNANIIFVDYKGVGELSGSQGLGIVENLRAMYGKGKWIIFYSAHKLPLDVYDKGANSYLAKNATVYEMERKIIEGAQNVIT